MPEYKLVWGGHPSITPLVYHVVEKRGLEIQRHVTLYQSKFFEKFYPPDNNKFENVIQTENLGERESSLLLMRETMFQSSKFVAGIFIGGMDGVEAEFKLFTDFHPNAPLLPIASTGAASQILFKKMNNPDRRLLEDYAYTSLFNDLLLNNRLGHA